MFRATDHYTRMLPQSSYSSTAAASSTADRPRAAVVDKRSALFCAHARNFAMPRGSPSTFKPGPTAHRGRDHCVSSPARAFKKSTAANWIAPLGIMRIALVVTPVRRHRNSRVGLKVETRNGHPNIHREKNTKIHWTKLVPTPTPQVFGPAAGRREGGRKARCGGVGGSY